MRKAEIITSLILMTAGLIMIFIVIPAQTYEGEGYGAPPAMLPTVAASLITGLSLILLVKNLRRKPEDGDANPMNKASWLHIGRYGLLLLLSLFALKYLHFIIGGIVIIAAFMLAAGQRNLLKIGILAVSIPCLLYAALWYGLRIPLP